MVLTLMSRKSLEAEEVVAHAVVRVGNLHLYPVFGAESHSVMDRQKFSKVCGHLELQSEYSDFCSSGCIGGTCTPILCTEPDHTLLHMFESR